MERERLGSSAGFLCFDLRHAIVRNTTSRKTCCFGSIRLLLAVLDVMESLIG